MTRMTSTTKIVHVLLVLFLNIFEPFFFVNPSGNRIIIEHIQSNKRDLSELKTSDHAIEPFECLVGQIHMSKVFTNTKQLKVQTVVILFIFHYFANNISSYLIVDLDNPRVKPLCLINLPVVIHTIRNRKTLVGNSIEKTQKLFFFVIFKFYKFDLFIFQS